MFIEMFDREEALKQLRRDEVAKLERERNLVRPMTMPALAPQPGVYEEEIHPPGEHWVKILTPSGRVGIVHFPDELWDDSVMPNLWKRYRAKTDRKLKIV